VFLLLFCQKPDFAFNYNYQEATYNKIFTLLSRDKRKMFKKYLKFNYFYNRIPVIFGIFYEGFSILLGYEIFDF